MQTLAKRTEVYHVDTEEAAIGMIEEAKDNQIEQGYTLRKSGYTLKTKKAKGEIIDSYYIVTLEKSFID